MRRERTRAEVAREAVDTAEIAAAFARRRAELHPGDITYHADAQQAERAAQIAREHHQRVKEQEHG